MRRQLSPHRGQLLEVQAAPGHRTSALDQIPDRPLPVGTRPGKQLPSPLRQESRCVSPAQKGGRHGCSPPADEVRTGARHRSARADRSWNWCPVRMDGAQPYADSSHRFGSLVVFPRTEEAKSRAAIPKKLWPDEAVRAAMGTAATAHSNRRTHPRLVGITRTLGAVSDPITAVAQLRHAAVSVSVAAVAELLDAAAVRAVVHQPSAACALHHFHHPPTRRGIRRSVSCAAPSTTSPPARLRVPLLPTGWNSCWFAGRFDPEEISLDGAVDRTERGRIAGWGRRGGVFGLSLKYVSSPLPYRYVEASRRVHRPQTTPAAASEVSRPAPEPQQPSTATAGQGNVGETSSATCAQTVSGGCARAQTLHSPPTGGLDCEG
jgi:hypothetical protein